MNELFDVTARRFHQWSVIALSALAFALDGPTGGALMLVVGLIMVAGRFWDEVDLFRLIYRGVLKPSGLLREHMVTEDRATRRVARVLGGSAQIAAGALLIAGIAPAVAGGLVAVIGVMIALDAALDFCALCFVVHQVRRVQGAPS